MKHSWEYGVGKYTAQSSWAPMFVQSEDFVLGKVLTGENLDV